MVAARSGLRELLGLAQVTKSYGGDIYALRGVDFVAEPATIHGLVGANGAGKSTLIKIMSGAIAPTSGSIRWHGEQCSWHQPGDALRAGIATVHQHSPLVGTLSVLENVFLAREGDWLWSRSGRLADYQRLCELVGYELPHGALVSELSIGDRQMVAILQAISQEPQLLILDEPTASLSAEEREIVHAAMQRLRDSGTSIVFVSHLLDEVMSLTGRVTVIRDGRVSLDIDTESLSHERLVEAIVGGEVQSLEDAGHMAGRARLRSDQALLAVEKLSSPGKVQDVSLTVGPGEVVGLAGLLGSGRSEILHAIYGADRHATGSVRLNDARIGRTTVAAVRAGMALVPEDRKEQGLVSGWEIWRNVTLPFLAEHSAGRLLPSATRELEQGWSVIEQLHVHPARPDVLIDELSGGNAQKTVFAKWIHPHVRLLLLDEPTAGVDIGAKRDIQLLIRGLTEQGIGVIVVDSEFEELLAVADRVLVIRSGRIVAERVGRETTEAELLALASGLGRVQETSLD